MKKPDTLNHSIRWYWCGQSGDGRRRKSERTRSTRKFRVLSWPWAAIKYPDSRILWPV